MHTAVPTKEGFVPFRGYRTWYRIVGDREEPGKSPLLCLHGGPGLVWDAFEPLEVITASGRRVIFYDQLGSGNSDEPHNPSMYTVDLYVGENAAPAAPVSVHPHACGENKPVVVDASAAGRFTPTRVGKTDALAVNWASR